MGAMETLRQMMVLGEKPYHFTGEISEEKYLHRLDENERLSLTTLLRYFQTVASTLKTLVSILAVGSSADLQSRYGDIDLLICPEDTQKRSEFIERVYEVLAKDTNFIVAKESPKGSSPLPGPPPYQNYLHIQNFQLMGI